jgi:hypothetical protein
MANYGQRPAHNATNAKNNNFAEPSASLVVLRKETKTNHTVSNADYLLAPRQNVLWAIN